MVRRFASLIVISLICLCSMADLWAQEGPAFTLDVRAGDHQGYSRLVFDWNDIVGYRVEQKEETLHIAFDTPATAKLPDVSSIDYIRSLNVPAQKLKGAATQIDALIPKGAKHRHFRLGQKIVVDVFSAQIKKDAPSSQVLEKPESDMQDAKAPEPEDSPVVLVPEQKAQTDVKDDLVEKEDPKNSPEDSPKTSPALDFLAAPPDQATDENEEVVSSDKKEDQKSEAPEPSIRPSPEEIASTAVPLKAVEALMPKEKIEDVEQEDIDLPEAASPARVEPSEEGEGQSTVVTVSTIKPVRGVVFSRAGALWIVLETDLSGVPPQITGPLRSFLGQPQRFDLDGATAFRLVLPNEYTVFANRTGLTWSITLSKSGNHTTKADNFITTEFSDDGVAKRVVAELEDGVKVFELIDPLVGDTLYVSPVSTPGLRIDQLYDTIDFDILKSAAGLVVAPQSDNVSVTSRDYRVMVTKQDGLNVSAYAQAIPLRVSGESEITAPVNRLFNLPNWYNGGPDNFFSLKRELEDRLKLLSAGERTTPLLELAQLHFANNLGPETLGILRLAASENKNLLRNPDFLALRGAARALAGKNEEAYADLSIPALKDEPEAALWRGFAASGAEQWRAAQLAFANGNELVQTYPGLIGIRVRLFMAEAALRHGKTVRARTMLRTIENAGDMLQSQHRAALTYLKAVADYQDGAVDQAIEKWQSLDVSRDRQYRAKAGLSLVLAKLEKGEMTEPEAIERLDVLRFAWRGDSLEIRIMKHLAKMIIHQGGYRDGLLLLRQAAELAEIEDDRRDIARTMSDTFHTLFVENKAAELRPLEALSIYNEFSELTPPGAEGDKAIQQLVTNLIKVDLLGRAAKVLDQQVDYRLKNPVDIARVSTRLAAVRLLDEQPKLALIALEKAALDPAAGQDEALDQLKIEQRLLKARALSDLKRPDAALSELEGLTGLDVDQLRAAINWDAKRWDAAKRVLRSIVDTYYGGTENITTEKANVLLNLAVATRLAGDAQGLSMLSETYSRLMQETSLANAFHIVTRPPGRTTLADRETMKELVLEVDTFKGFLEAYRSTPEVAESAGDEPASVQAN